MFSNSSQLILKENNRLRNNSRRLYANKFLSNGFQSKSFRTTSTTDPLIVETWNRVKNIKLFISYGIYTSMSSVVFYYLTTI